ncbi:unnamed protein product, partial [Protopolystoma xenopodis]
HFAILTIDTRSKRYYLKKDRIKWRSQVPITVNQLLRKRNEFWDTAPAFDGRKEIWDALKAAAEAMERHDHDLAQAIIDGADIIVPSGYLCDCYDQLGAHYQLPLYVLSPPSNLLVDTSRAPHPHSRIHSYRPTGIPVSVAATGESEFSQCLPSSSFPSASSSSPSVSFFGPSSLSVTPTLAARPEQRRPTTRQSTFAHLRAPRLSKLSGRFPRLWRSATTSTGTGIPKVGVDSVPGDPKESEEDNEMALHLRLSTGEEVIETLSQSSTVLEAKRRLASRLPDVAAPVTRQRWFCAGHPLTNRLRLIDCSVPEGFIIQVIVHTPFMLEADWRRPTQNKMG